MNKFFSNNLLSYLNMRKKASDQGLEDILKKLIVAIASSEAQRMGVNKNNSSSPSNQPAGNEKTEKQDSDVKRDLETGVLVDSQGRIVLED